MKEFGVWAISVIVLGIVSNGKFGTHGYDNFSDDDYKLDFPNQEDDGTLKLVFAMFRHGNRTPDGIIELYPKDPYLNLTYFPYGLGQLTNAGKIKQYYVGTELRNRYNNFLGKYYYPDLVEATSTDYNRTKMSLELVLAGLFPPRKDDAVLGIPWQPVPFNFLPRTDDIVLLGPECPKYVELYEEYTRLSSVQEKFHKYKEIFEYISRHSGLNVTTFKDIYYLHFGLATEEEYGLSLPNWTKSVWPDQIMSLSTEEYFISTGTPEMRRLAVGYFWQKLLADVRAKMQNGKKLSRKIHLYSAHESTMAHLMISMKVFDNMVPPYSSYLVWELHKIRGVYGLKIYYRKFDASGFKLLQMPGCKEFCPLDVFTALIEEYLPIDDGNGNPCSN